MITTSRRARPVLVVLGGLLMPVLAACTVNIGTTAASSGSSSAVASASASASAGQSSAVPAPGGVTAAQGQSNVARVNCSNSTCTVTLSGNSRVTTLGTTLSLKEIKDGRATLNVGDQTVTFGPGETATSGPLTLRCTAVTGDSVTFTASLG